MATNYSLAPEILSSIFELNHDPHKPSTTCAAALVCRAWRHPAQRVLFLDIAVPMVDLNKSNERGMFERWESYKSNRLHTPRRGELYVLSDWGNQVIAPGSFRLQTLSGVRELVIVGGLLRPDFLSDWNLRGLERVTFRPSEWSYPKFTGDINPPRPRATWPANLRILGIDSFRLDTLIQAYQLQTSLDSITLEIPGMWEESGRLLSSNLIPATITDLSIILTVPNHIGTAVPFFSSVRNLHRLTFVFQALHIRLRLNHVKPVIPAFLDALVGSLPSSLKRFELKNVGGNFPLLETPFKEILDLFSGGGLPNLAWIDFPDCKREDLENEPAAADLLAECERRSIRIVFGEESL